MAVENVIEIKGLLNKVAGQVLHKDLDYEVRGDEVMTRVGGSGSGKTQLLRVIIGLKAPAGGSVHVFGASLTRDGHDAVRAATTARVTPAPRLSVFGRMRSP